MQCAQGRYGHLTAIYCVYNTAQACPQNVSGNEMLYMYVLSLDCVSMYALSGEKEIPMKENSAYEGVQIQPPNRGNVNQMEPCPAYGVVGARQ